MASAMMGTEKIGLVAALEAIESNRIYTKRS